MINEKEKNEELIFHYTEDIFEEDDLLESDDNEDEYLTPKKEIKDDIEHFLEDIENRFNPLKVKNKVNEKAPESNWERFLFLRKKVNKFLKKKYKTSKRF